MQKNSYQISGTDKEDYLDDDSNEDILAEKILINNNEYE